VLVLGRDMLGKFCYKIGCREELYVFLKVLIILCLKGQLPLCTA
jgi:hypothetical protein